MNRKPILLLILCLMALTLQAQELTVKEMKAVPMDLSASQYERKDLAGQPCGLVKVQLVAVDAQFEGNVIKPVEYKTGEYWVYMTEGSYMLSVKHPQFVPLHVNFRNYGINGIESKVTYVLTLLMPQTGQAVDDGMRYLVLNVEPKNSTVFINEEQREVKEDGTVRVQVSKGVHNYRVSAPGYTPETGRVEVGDSKVTKTVVLKSEKATLSISCPTSGAQVYIDEEPKGTLPWNGQLTAGSHSVEARLSSYRSNKQSVTLGKRETRQLEIPALMPITSSLNVDYQPTDAEVWLDGKQLGTSPDIFRGILVGQHQLEIRKNGYQTKKETVEIKEGKVVSLSGQLQRSAGLNTTTGGSGSNLLAQSLKDAYKDYFMMGVAINQRNVTNPEQQTLILREFNCITSENDMKPVSTEPREGEFNWENADRIANFARKNGIKLRGNYLMWHNQIGRWMTEGTTKEQFYKRMKKHIQTVISRYKDVVYSWDVINEAISDDANATNPYRQSTIYKLCGDEFIEKAFQYAHEADPKALLFYNDYSTVAPHKRDRIYNMVKKMKDKGVPIDGIGMQGHYTIYFPSEELLDQAITKFKTIVKHIQITELDIRLSNEMNIGQQSNRESANVTDSVKQYLADQYARCFRVFRKHKDVIDCVTFGNLSDRDSWLGVKNYPLPFDKEYKPKLAYEYIKDMKEPKWSMPPQPARQSRP